MPFRRHLLDSFPPLTFGWANSHCMNPVSDCTSCWVPLDADGHVQVVGVGPVHVVEAGDVALVLVVVLRTPRGSEEIGAVTLDLRNSHIPPAKISSF